MPPSSNAHARAPFGEPDPAIRAAERLVLASIGPRDGASPRTAQELPKLALVGAAIARAAQLAEADARARLAHLGLANTQAAGLLRPSRRELDALLDTLVDRNEAEDGRPLPPTTGARGFVWRLHPAPAPAGAAVAPDAAPSTDGATR
jgi:hypothetical protein